MGALLRLRPMWVPASLAIDRPIHARLIGESTMQQDRQRLMTAEHAGAWVTAVPSRIDGSDCIMSPAVFRTAVRYRLGVAVAHEGVVCSFCKQSFDIYGHHAGCCKKNADIIIRHNRIRNLVSRIGQEGLLSPVLEKRGIFGDSKKLQGALVSAAGIEPRPLALIGVAAPKPDPSPATAPKPSGGRARHNPSIIHVPLLVPQAPDWRSRPPGRSGRSRSTGAPKGRPVGHRHCSQSPHCNR